VTTPVRRSAGRARALVAGLVVVSALEACSNKDVGYPTYVPPPGDGGTAGTGGGLVGGLGGHIGVTGLGGAIGGVDAGTPSGTVSITIQSPTANAILSNNAAAPVSAKVIIANGTDIVDPSSVRVSLIQDGAVAPVSATPLVGPSGNLFTGKLSLAGLRSGDYTLTVTAKSSTNLSGSSSVKVKIDGGPVITVLSPVPGHHYKGSIIVQAVIDPGSYPPVSSIACSVAGTPLTLQPAGPPNQYRAVFDLSMPIALTGDQLFEMSANDANTKTDIKFMFNVDITGPEITMPVPAAGSITGNVIRLAANIDDAAGLDDSSLQVLIGDKTMPQFKLALALDTTGAYSVLFDTKLLTPCRLPLGSSLCIVRPTISFRAADALGNEATLAYEIALDNIPPVADLVPPPIRVSKLDDGLRCSFAFDPLGGDNNYSGDSPDDGCRVPQLFDLRARIEDSGNYGTGIKQIPIAGVDPEVTAVYILAETAQPLVVDQDGDGFCDVINPKLIPTTSPLTGAPRQVLKVRLKPVPPAGAGDFRADLTVPAGCEEGQDLNPPVDICKVEQPKVAISYAGGVPAIWSIEPIAPDDARYCFGSQFDTFANNVADSASATGGGWRCIAVATADMNGNLSTSAPIRVWVDYKYQDPANWCDMPPANAGAPPSCTGTYDKATDTLTAKACTSRKFSPGEICFNNDCF
jgi:hypothetical protein